MNSRSHSIRLIRLFGSLALVFTFAPDPIAAQRRRPSASTPRRSAVERQEDARRRTRAIALLDETADTARLFDDLFYRARIQTLAADALWPADHERARAIFRRAWDAATAADKAAQEEDERESGTPSDSTGTFVTESRDEVLSKVAARDPQLAELFLRDLSGEREDEKNGGRDRTTHRTPWRELSANGMRHLAVALDLLNRGEAGRAAQIAAPVIDEGVSAELMAFILRLREQSAPYADGLYLQLLERTRADAAADANDVLLLSSPIVSPSLLVTVDERGSLQYRPIVYAATGSGQSNKHLNTPVAQATRNAFYETAAAVLLRPLAAPGTEAGDATPGTAVALYFAIGRLLAFFEREAAPYVPELRARQGGLAKDFTATRRDALSSQFDLHSLTSNNPGDPLGSQTEQLSRARDQEERDRIALAITKAAARIRAWDRARRTASSIEDVGARRAALSFIAVSEIADISRAFAEDKEDDFEGVAKFVRGADVPPLASAWGLAQAATIAARKGKKPAAAQLLYEAERDAARVETGTSRRVAAYAVVTTAAAGIEAARSWDLLAELVKAANAAEDYSGDEVSIDIPLDGNPEQDAEDNFSVAAEAFRLDTIFATMSRIDFDRALSTARALRDAVPRAFAQMAIARAGLGELKALKEKDQYRDQKSGASTRDEQKRQPL